MKKYFLFIPFILLFSILFLMGCSNKNENKNNDIPKDTTTTSTTKDTTSDDGAVSNTSVVQTSDVEDEDTVKLDIFYNLFNPKNNQLLNTFDKKPNDMGNVSETIRCDYNTYVDLFSSPNEGYTFVGWYNEGQVLSNEKNYKYMMWDKDFTIEARFRYTLYNLKVWSNNSDLGQVMIRDGYSQTFYNEETLEEYYTEQVTIVAYSKTDTRRFLGWYDENNKLVSTNAVYTFNMVNRDYTLEAKWDYFNITYDLDGGINDLSNPSYYTVDTQNIILKSPTKEGYTFQGWEYNGDVITEINTSKLCHIKLKAIWVYYTLTTRANNDKAGTISAYNNTKITEGKSITITAQTNPGYTFNGWFDGNNELTTNSSYTFNMPAENLSYTAKWTANATTPYKVEHYLQNIENDNYPSTPYEVDNLFGTTDTFTDASVKTYEGFTSPLITQAIISGNGETVIRINYSRNLYNIYLNKNNNGGQVIGAGKYKYDKSITIEATIFDGYTFEGWYDGTRQITDKLLYSFKMPETNLNYTAKWTANTDTPYKVEHYFQNADNDNYPIIPNELDYLVGTTDTLTKAEAKSYIGFESPTITQINIDGSGETIVKLYYKRSSYNISFSPEIYAKDGFSNINETFKPNEYFSINKSTFSGLFSDDVGIDGVDYLGNSKIYTYANDTYVNCSISSYIKITVPTDNSRLYVAFVSTQSSVLRGMFVGTTISANFNDEIAGSYTNGLEMTYIDVKLDKGVYYLNYTGKVRIFEMYLIENKCIYGSVSGEGLYKYGKSVTIKATTNPGYTFDGWFEGDRKITSNESFEFNMPANDLTYIAKWTANTNTPYKVKHYKQNLDDSNYPDEPFEIDNLTGTTNTQTNYSVKTYKGFISPYITQVNINGDGSTVINLYYKRETCTVSLSRNIEAAGTVAGTGTYKYGKSIKITAITNPGYTFNGWYKKDVLFSKNESFELVIDSSYIGFKAFWTANTDTPYKVEHYLQNLDDDNYPNIPYEIDYLTGTTDTLTKAEVKSYIGFELPTITQINIDGNGETLIKLYYERLIKHIYLSTNNDDACILTGGGEYKYGKEIVIKVKTNDGYTFNGWYKNEVLFTTEESFDYTVGIIDEFYEARFTINKYKIIINNLSEDVTVSGIISGAEYDFGSQIDLSASNIPDGYTMKWERNDGEVFLGVDSYCFTVPSFDAIITVQSILPKQYIRKGSKLYFGSYPQTLVLDEGLISELNTIAGINYSSSGGWSSDYCYISNVKRTHMYYKDIDYDGDGIFDYRGVYINQYKPRNYSLSSSELNSYQDDNGYDLNKTYWFSFDTIEWDILSISEDKALIITDLLLDAKIYYPSNSDLPYDYNGSKEYVSNYGLSNIRTWLNNSFYNTAFNSEQKRIIELSTVDNSGCGVFSSVTDDEIFLLKGHDIPKNLINTNGTDYAKCQGLSDASLYWTRSAYYNNKIIGANGGTIYVCWQNVGVRPSCCISL